MPRPKPAQYDLMAAAGIAECAHRPRSVELRRVGLEPTRSKINVADRSRIARLRRLAEIQRGDENPSGRQRTVDASIVQPIAVVPRAAVHIDDAREWPASFGLINTRQPRLARQALILDVPLFDFELLVGFHAGNLLPPGAFLQARRTSQNGRRHQRELALVQAARDTRKGAAIMSHAIFNRCKKI